MKLFPSDAGTYGLVLSMDRANSLVIGKLGYFNFSAGWYIYTGSAHGPGGLRGRVQHHLRPVVRPHWHIDYLRAAAAVQAVWFSTAQTVSEHGWAECLGSMDGAAVPAPGFGASDCRCRTHLFHFSTAPELLTFRQRCGGNVQNWEFDAAF